VALALSAIGAAVLAVPSSAEAATNAAKPTPANWGVFQDCGSSYPGENCAEIRATAEDPATKTVYAAGMFTQLSDPATGRTLGYQDLVALDESSGAVDTGFAAHRFNGEIFAAAFDPAADLVVVGGNFTTVDGAATASGHVAAFDASSGAQVTAFKANTNGPVRALLYDATRNVVYVGGRFTAVNKIARSRLAAVSASNGQVVSTFTAPSITWTETPRTAATEVRTVELGADAGGNPMLYIGGHFDTVGGRPHESLARLSATTGALDDSFAPTLNAQSPDDLQAVDKIVWIPSSADGKAGIVVAQAGHINRAYRFATSGALLWTQKPDGDVQAAAVSGSTVYFGGHFQCDSTGTGSCLVGKAGGFKRVHLVAVDLTSGAIDTGFAPSLTPKIQPYYYGVWSLMVDSNGALWAGGVFTTVFADKSYSRPKLAVFPKV
jgi:hypothetical protein